MTQDLILIGTLTSIFACAGLNQARFDGPPERP